MLSYTGARNLYGRYTNNNTSTNLSVGDTLINEAIRVMLGGLSWPFLENQVTVSTVDGQQFYNLPANLEKVVTISVTVGNYKYRPRQLASFDEWDAVNATTGIESDTTSYFFVYNGQVGLWPIPASNGNTITITYQKVVRDLSIADYTTGTIVSIANGFTTLVGSGTSWTSQMAGRFIKITYSNTANTGDGFWYEVDSVTSATELELKRAYRGTSIAAGSAAYTLGDCMVIPERYQMAPVYWATADYWRKEGDAGKADRFQSQYEYLLEQMRDDEGKKTIDYAIDEGDDRTLVNPNLAIYFP